MSFVLNPQNERRNEIKGKIKKKIPNYNWLRSLKLKYDRFHCYHLS